MLRYFLILVAVSQFLAAGVPRAFDLGQGIGARAIEGGIAAELPPGLFFAIIWNVIFALYLIHAIMAARRGGYVDRQLAGPLAVAGAANIVWMLSAQFVGSLWLDLFLLFPVMAGAWTASRRLDWIGGFDGTGARLMLCAVTGLLSGWISVAVSISLPDIVRTLAGHGASDFVWPYLWLTLGAAAALAFAFTRWISRSLWYFAGLGWGIAGIAVNTLSRLDMPLLGYVAIAFGFALLFLRLTRGADGAKG